MGGSLRISIRSKDLFDSASSPSGGFWGASGLPLGCLWVAPAACGASGSGSLQVGVALVGEAQS
jgi:hypothetical protein